MKEGTVMAQATMIVAINRPIEQVFAFVANAEAAPQWQSDVVEVQRTTAGPVGEGTAYRTLRTHLRERTASIVSIVEYEPLSKISFETVAEDIRFRDSYAFDSVGDCTRVTYSFELATRARGTRRVLSKEAAHLSDLKTVLEAQARAGYRGTHLTREASRTGAV